jgi:pyruvate/2-oxoglutarate dehydrogenase complex dihydrolipoamide dehydrogenase (E3) component
LLVIGAGPIGCELAQAFVHFGSSVTVLDQASHVLPREDADAASIVQRRLIADGVRLELGVKLIEAMTDRGRVCLRFERANGTGVADASGDRLLIAAGRAPNVEGFGLEAAGVAVSKQGVMVNDRLQTSNRRIYAAGDVCSSFQFTHAADAMARIVIQNALFYGRRRASALVIPWCTYTDPEVAHVGLYEQEARTRGHDVQSITVGLADVDRAVIDDETDGFVRVHHERGRLLGCTIVASHAGEWIGEAAFALTHRRTLSDLSSTIHPYPTQAEALRKAGDQYRRSLLTARVRGLLERYFRWTR